VLGPEPSTQLGPEAQAVRPRESCSMPLISRPPAGVGSWRWITRSSESYSSTTSSRLAPEGLSPYVVTADGAVLERRYS
jgi:hypothetical protein